MIPFAGHDPLERPDMTASAYEPRSRRARILSMFLSSKDAMDIAIALDIPEHKVCRDLHAAREAERAAEVAG